MLIKLKLMNLRDGAIMASIPYFISGLVTRLSCILCRLVFVLFWCLSLASMQSHLLILMLSAAALLLL